MQQQHLGNDDQRAADRHLAKRAFLARNELRVFEQLDRALQAHGALKGSRTGFVPYSSSLVSSVALKRAEGKITNHHKRGHLRDMFATVGDEKVRRTIQAMSDSDRSNRTRDARIACTAAVLTTSLAHSPAALGDHHLIMECLATFDQARRVPNDFGDIHLEHITGEELAFTAAFRSAFVKYCDWIVFDEVQGLLRIAGETLAQDAREETASGFIPPPLPDWFNTLATKPYAMAFRAAVNQSSSSRNG